MVELLTPEERVQATLDDPVRFATYALGQDLWPIQEEILYSVANNPRTAIKACHSSGKSFISACAVLWWLAAHGDGIVITTAPTWTQVKRILWGEIRKLARVCKLPFPEPNLTDLNFGPDRYAMGLSTNEGVNFQGFHGRILIVIDEAPGVSADIYDAIEGIRAGGRVSLLALGNPVIASGPFYEAFTTNRSTWATRTISAFDTPNLQDLDLESLLSLSEDELDDNPRPYLTTRRWVYEKYHEWGPGHPLWESRVMGRFPLQAEDALISLAWLEAAKNRRPISTGGRVTAGLDVAGPGEDETVLVIREGPNILEMKSWSRSDPRGAVLTALAPYNLEYICVDAVGIGYGMFLHLRDHGLPVRAVNVGEAPRDKEKYYNLKAEAYWGLRMRFAEGDVAGLTDETAIAQLVGIRYEHNARGQVVIESKEKARKRGVKSPDRAEAVMLAFHEPYAEFTSDDLAISAADYTPDFSDELSIAWKW